MLKGLLKLGLIAGVGCYATCAALRYARRFDLTGRTVLITGGSRGLGLAMAREFALKGAKLALVARSAEELGYARRLLAPATVGTFVADITDIEKLPELVRQIENEMGPISVLVNNAGALTVGPENSMTEGDYDIAMRTIYEAPLKLMRLLIPDLKRRGEGRIINIASFGGKVPVPHMAPYAAAKHALVGLSESLRTELVDHNIFVTTVCPGMIDNGAPVNVLFRGRAREEFGWFSAGAVSPVAADPVALAKRIVRACIGGEGAVVYPFNARVMSALHGITPNVSLEVITMGERTALPADDRDEGLTKGMALSRKDPAEAERMAMANAGGLPT